MIKVLIGFVMDGRAGGVDKYILDFYERLRGKEIAIDLLTSAYSEQLAEQLAADGAKLQVCPKLTAVRGQYTALKRLVKENGYTVVYFNYSTAIGWAALKGARDGGARVILHAHNSGFSDESPLKEFVYKTAHYLFRPLSRKYATDLLACSDKAARWMFGSRAVKKGRTIYIKNEVASNTFTPSAEKRLHFRTLYGLRDSLVIGNVGGMLKAKNQAFLIRLLPQLKKRIPHAKLLLVGDGPERKRLEVLARQLQVADDVVFTGYLNTADGIMNAFDVFCLPSFIEGYPYVSVEAQLLSLPCIFSKHVTAQIVHTSTCAFLPLGDPTAWVEQLVRYAGTDRQEIRFIENGSDDRFITFSDFMHDLSREISAE